MPNETGRPTAAQEDYAADRAAIMQLEAEYLMALDWGDAESYAALFAPEGVLEWAGGTAVGPEEIYKEIGVYKEAIKQYYGDDGSGQPVTLRHFITNQAIYVHGDTAKGVIYWFEVANNGTGHTPHIGSYGHYEDRMRKVDGAWKFVSRKIFNEQLPSRRAGAENPGRAARLP
ncbi:hypothetical protein M2337_002601 [Sphingobium sp. B2D3A]|uniref:nuclear transport factor 2 family protein n=1 Tax=unclassified Sphingobium TaxID=2611147 RepID=UPI0022257065|nr:MULTISPECIES: nuclear transport factor 2 family protein [unclassified Sphingobium]MCW2338368.1 hypothetical protein [Sphingobium sp. B2D3A]MCW2384826.1 hypothetical protein [Sphingobium sp. B2D3D]MCW2391062.1 hypothetical protein [Sphingobium sp. B11D3A]MCW2406271.1 hypothetical protein [Sphingobium sp. B1D7B]